MFDKWLSKLGREKAAPVEEETWISDEEESGDGFWQAADGELRTRRVHLQKRY